MIKGFPSKAHIACIQSAGDVCIVVTEIPNVLIQNALFRPFLKIENEQSTMKPKVQDDFDKCRLPEISNGSCNGRSQISKYLTFWHMQYTFSRYSKGPLLLWCLCFARHSSEHSSHALPKSGN